MYEEKIQLKIIVFMRVRACELFCMYLIRMYMYAYISVYMINYRRKYESSPFKITFFRNLSISLPFHLTHECYDKSHDNYRVINCDLHDRYLRVHASCRGEKPRESIIVFRKRTFMPIQGM